jgi:hydroxypyruvate isomerase
MLRFSANLTWLFNEVPFLDRFAAAARSGFGAVEFVSPYEHEPGRLEERIRSNALAVSVFNLPAGDWAAGDRGMACDPARVGEFQESVGRALEYAGPLGCRMLHAMAGNRPPGASEEAMREAYLSNLRFAAKELAKRGLRLAIEAINTRDMPGYYLTTSRQAFELIREAGVENLFFQYDAYHIQVMEGDLTFTLERELPRIGHVQIADVPGRHEPGTGEINYDFLLRQIDRLGYRGWIGCEYRPLTTTEAGLGWMRRFTEGA